MEIITLEKAIKHAEEVAEEKDMQAGFDTDYLCYQMSDIERNECKKCAEEHRQLAEWLKDYKRLLEQKSDSMHRGMPGRWIVKDYYTKIGEYYKGYECSACRKEYNLKTNFCPNCGNRNGECRMIREALEQESCKDCVSRDAIKLKIAEMPKYTNSKKIASIRHLGDFLEKELEEPIEVTPDMCIGFTTALECIREFIMSLPPVTSKPKTGYWIYDYTSADGHKTYHCSECGCYLQPKHSEPLNSFKWCSLCGADMREIAEALEQEPCEDAVSRQAIIDMTGLSEWFDSSDSYNNFVFALSELPPVTPKSKTGQWIRMSDLSEQEDDRYKCSHCGNVIHHKNKMNLYTFNSWCGRCGSDNGRK